MPRKKSKEQKIPPIDLRRAAPDIEFLKANGFDPDIRQEHIQDFQVAFLEELSLLWEFSIMRWHAVQSAQGGNVVEQIKEIAVLEAPIIERAKKYLQAVMFVRLAVDVRCNVLNSERCGDPKLVAISEEARKIEMRKCRDSMLYFINQWCWIHEPRFPEIGLPASIPFVMYPKQQEVVERMLMCYHNRLDLLVEKSREAGISWVACAMVVWQWLFTPNYTAILASEKEDKVDLRGSRKTLFGKIRHLIYTLPHWMLPDTYRDEHDVKRDGPNDNFMKIINPDNRAEVTGEAGLNIGRSGRGSQVIIDESQSISTPEALDAALESVTNNRIDIGTPMGMNHFGRRRFSNTVPVVTIAWYDDPRKNKNWRNGSPDDKPVWKKYNELKTPDKTVLAQEYYLDYNASVEDCVIESTWVRAAIDFDLPMEGVRAAGFDVADSGANEAVYVERIGPVVLPMERMNFKTAADGCIHAIRQAIDSKVEMFNYDRDGVGVAVPTILQMLDDKPPFRIIPIRGNSSPSDNVINDEGKTAKDEYGNKRAELYYMARERFRKTYEHRNEIHFYPANEMISIPNDPELISQLSQAMKKFRGIKLGVESKKDMKGRGVKSPDKADAMIYSFYDSWNEDLVVSNFDYTSKKKHYVRFEKDFNKPGLEFYVSIYQTDKLSIHVIFAAWDGRAQLLKIFDEIEEYNPIVEQIANRIFMIMNPGANEVKEYLANAEMFKGIEKGTECMYYPFKKAGINLRQNYSADDRSSIHTINEMFELDMIQLHDPDCEKTMNQVLNWSKQNGKGNKKLGNAMALCQLVSKLKTRRLLKKLPAISYGYGLDSKFNSERPSFTPKSAVY